MAKLRHTQNIPRKEPWNYFTQSNLPHRGGGGVGLTNERPGSDHETWGPMRGLKKDNMKRGHQTVRQTDTHRDSMKESAKGRFFEN